SASFYPNWDKNNGLRVNFTGSSLSQIDEGAERLGRILSPAQTASGSTSPALASARSMKELSA
ncbi:PLP-dependent aminotransferase family protein, partial [Lactobacillus delbrueckii subsp. bulgaricus]|nr:hypothetical protein [Lactobacillus delbrueckii subsp. bulgaricus]